MTSSIDLLEYARRLGALQRRLERALALPRPEHTTLEERLAEVERQIVEVQVAAMLDRFRTHGEPPDRSMITKLEQFEAFVSQMEPPQPPRDEGTE